MPMVVLLLTVLMAARPWQAHNPYEQSINLTVGCASVFGVGVKVTVTVTVVVR